MPGTHGSGCGCAAECVETGGEFLLPYINTQAISALNEKIPDSIVGVFKPHSERTDESKFCASVERDPEMIVHIPFTSPCKLVSLYVIGGENGTSASQVSIFKDTPDLDFTNARDTKPIQVLDLVEDFCGVVEYPLKAALLQNVIHLTLYFSKNMGADNTEIYYIGVKGTGSNYKREAVVAAYETLPKSSHTDVAKDAPTAGY